MIIPALKDWMESTFGASMQHKSLATVSVINIFFYVFNEWQRRPLSHSYQNHNDFFLFQPVLTSSAVQPPNLNEAFVEDLKTTGIPYSHDAEDRVFRAHGKTHWEKTPKNHTHRKSPPIMCCL